MLEDYEPKIVTENYAEVLVEITKCHICNKYMLNSVEAPYGLFPKYVKLCIEEQLKRAGWSQRSCVKVDDEYICVDCEQAGRADFLCALCNQRKTTDREEESFGDPAEYFCKDCYETVPAKIWQEKVKKMLEIHKYDFE